MVRRLLLAAQCLAVIVVSTVLVGSCGTRRAAREGGQEVGPVHSVAYRLAERDGQLNDTVRYERAISEAQRKTRSPAQEICDATLASHGILKARGAKITVLDMMNISLARLPSNVVRESTTWAPLMSSFAADYQIGPSSDQQSENPSGARSDMAQLERTFKMLMASGIVTAIDDSHPTPWVMVGSGFYALPYEQKEAAAQAISDYWAALKGGNYGSAVAFELHDRYTGERLYSWNGVRMRK